MIQLVIQQNSRFIHDRVNTGQIVALVQPDVD